MDPAAIPADVNPITNGAAATTTVAPPAAARPMPIF